MSLNASSSSPRANIAIHHQHQQPDTFTLQQNITITTNNTDNGGEGNAASFLLETLMKEQLAASLPYALIGLGITFLLLLILLILMPFNHLLKKNSRFVRFLRRKRFWLGRRHRREEPLTSSSATSPAILINGKRASDSSAATITPTTNFDFVVRRKKFKIFQRKIIGSCFIRNDTLQAKNL